MMADLRKPDTSEPFVMPTVKATPPTVTGNASFDEPLANLRSGLDALHAMASSTNMIEPEGLWPVHDWLDAEVKKLTAIVKGLEAGKAPEGAPCTDAIGRGIVDIDDPITQAEACSITLGTLIGLIPKDHRRDTLFDVQTQLESALIEARRIFIELHVAAGGAS